MANQYTPWTKEEDEQAIALRARHWTFKQIGNKLGRGEAAVQYRFQHVFNPQCGDYKGVAISDKAMAALYEPHGGAMAYRGR